MNIAIAGAGILGQYLAWVLQEKGFHITLFEAPTMANCSKVAGGLLTPLAELEKNEFIIYELGLKALKEHWPHFLKTTNAPVYFKQKGSLLVAHPRDEALLQQYLEQLQQKIDLSGLVECLDEKALAHLEPALSHFKKAYYFPEEGQIHQQQVLDFLKPFLISSGVQWVNEKVLSTRPREIHLQGETRTYDWVFDCRGLGATEWFQDLRGVRGEIISLRAPHITIERPVRLTHPRYSLYLVPRPDHMYLLGASEIESCDESEISLRTTLELLTALYALNPAFAEARILKTSTGVRPTLFDHRPKIKYTEGLIAVNGLYRHGILIAPTLVAEVVRWLTQQTQQYPSLWEAIT